MFLNINTGRSCFGNPVRYLIAFLCLIIPEIASAVPPNTEILNIAQANYSLETWMVSSLAQII